MPTKYLTGVEGQRFTAERNREWARRKKFEKRLPIIAIKKMQAALLELFDDEEQSATALASAATAWDRLEARKAILKGFGPPKPVPAANDPASSPKPINVMTISDDGPVARQLGQELAP